MSQRTEPAGAGGGLPARTARRLTAGWQHAAGAPDLAGHLRTYGPLPDGGRPAPGSLINAVAAAGLTGRGGAGFPTAVKMRAVASGHGPAVVVANGIESEPASHKDQALLAMAPHLVLDGAIAAAGAVGADAVHICLDHTRERQADTVIRAVRERQQAGLDLLRVQVHGLPHRYVASEETSVIRWLNGGEAKPVLAPPRPAERGVLRRPTLVANVETLAHIALIARFGPGWFRGAGHPDAPGTMLVTVTGAVAGPGVYEVESGSLVGEVLAVGGGGQDGSVLIGGYFGTWHRTREVAGRPLTAEGLRSAGGSPGAGVMFALPAESCGIMETARILAYLAGQSAQQCGPCSFGLPAIAADFRQLASGNPDGDVLGRLTRRLGVITGRGACRLPDGAVRMAASGLAAFGPDAHAHASRRPCLDARRRWPRKTRQHDGTQWAQGA